MVKAVVHFIVGAVFLLFVFYIWYTTQSYQPLLLKAFEFFLIILFLIFCIKHLIQFVLSFIDYKKALKYNALVHTIYNQQMKQLDRQGFHLDIKYDTIPKIFIDDIHKCFAILYESSPLQLYRYSDIIKISWTSRPKSIKLSLNNVYNPCILLRNGSLDNIEIEKLLSTLAYMNYSHGHKRS